MSEEVSEAFSSQTCPGCDTMPDLRPQGISGLGIRPGTCSNCGAVHDRDTNAARNILHMAHRALKAGIPVLQAKKDIKKCLHHQGHARRGPQRPDLRIDFHGHT